MGELLQGRIFGRRVKNWGVGWGLKKVWEEGLIWDWFGTFGGRKIGV